MLSEEKKPTQQIKCVIVGDGYDFFFFIEYCPMITFYFNLKNKLCEFESNKEMFYYLYTAEVLRRFSIPLRTKLYA